MKTLAYFTYIDFLEAGSSRNEKDGPVQPALLGLLEQHTPVVSPGPRQFIGGDMPLELGFQKQHAAGT